MGLLRDVTVGMLRAGLEVFQKAGAPPFQKKGEGGDGGDEGGGNGPPEPPPPPPPARDMPEPEIGSGPTLAAPAAETERKPQVIQPLDSATGEPRSLFWDPFAVVDALGYKDKPTAMSFQTLQAMVQRTPVVQAVIKTRVDQVSRCSEVQQDKYSLGFRVQMRNRRQAPTPASERASQSMERWLTTTGTTDNPVSRDSFDAFLKKVTRDSLVYDQMAWEVVPNRKGKPAEFYAVDAATIRIADTTRLHLDHNDTKVNRYVQIYDGLVVNEYTSQELLFGVRNPTTRIGAQQYGVSELEMLAHTITSMLWAWQYNEKLFSQGTSAKGILNFKGAIPEKQLRAFRTHWYMMAAGIENAHKTPIVNSDDLQWINMQNTNKDMEFSAWMDFLIKVVCGIYGMDPMEINFKYGDSGGAKSMFESSNNAKLSASKDKGLYPLLKFLELKINQSLIWALDEDFEFKFVGLEAQSPNEQADLTTKLVKTIKTVNEARAEEDMPPLPNGLGDVILDPVWMQHLTMAQGAQQQYDAAQHAAENPPPGQEGEDGFQEDGGDEDPDQDQPELDMGAEDDGEEGDKPAKPAKPAPVEKSLRKSQKRIVVDVEV